MQTSIEAAQPRLMLLIQRAKIKAPGWSLLSVRRDDEVVPRGAIIVCQTVKPQG